MLGFKGCQVGWLVGWLVRGICSCLPAFILVEEKVVAFSYFCNTYVYGLHQSRYYQIPKCKLQVNQAVSKPKLAISAALLSQLRDTIS